MSAARLKRCHVCGTGVKTPALSIKQRGSRETWHFCEDCAPKWLGVSVKEFNRLKDIMVDTEVWEV